ncbi:MAG TPA: hypothetical protein VFS33_10110 [Gemmatimonadales bacterium]|nr:hypothetical protein [Gemmatimonadales bacterium]
MTATSQSGACATLLVSLLALACSSPAGPTESPVVTPASNVGGVPPAYRSIELGTLGGTSATPFDVNDAGVVVGTSADATTDQGRPFTWTAGAGMRALGDFAGTAMAVSQRGTVVGVARLDASVAFGHAFVWTAANGAKDLGVLRTAAGDYSVANGVNAQDDIVGTDGSGSLQAFVGSAEQGLTPIPASGESQAFAINDRGEIAASESQGGTLPIQPFVWQASGQRTDISVPAGLNAAKPADINDAGDVTGDYSLLATPNDVQGFVWSSRGGFESFGFGANTSTVPVAINDRGEVVGNFAQLDTGRFGVFLWSKSGGLVDLTDRLGERSVAFGLNSQGWIVGIQYESLDPVAWRAMVWIPDYSQPSQRVAARPNASVAAIDPATKAALLRCFTDPSVRGNKAAFAACATAPGR